jgi:hypothetical protein
MSAPRVGPAPHHDAAVVEEPFDDLACGETNHGRAAPGPILFLARMKHGCDAPRALPGALRRHAPSQGAAVNRAAGGARRRTAPFAQLSAAGAAQVCPPVLAVAAKHCARPVLAGCPCLRPSHALAMPMPTAYTRAADAPGALLSMRASPRA